MLLSPLATGPSIPDAVPMEPPVIERVTNSSVIYYIDIALTTLPVFSFRLGYATIIIKVEDPSDPIPAYFVLVSAWYIIDRQCIQWYFFCSHECHTIARFMK